MTHESTALPRTQRTSLRESDVEKVMGLALEFPSRAVNCASLDELSFLLTNDLRTLAGFDRCFLVSHIHRPSRLVAATHQPELDLKSSIQAELQTLAEQLASVRGALVLGKETGFSVPAEAEISEETAQALRSYAELTGCEYLFCLPLLCGKSAVAHLLMEYHAGDPPDRTLMLTLVKVAPVFAAAFSTAWLLEKKPDVARLLDPAALRELAGHRFFRRQLPWVVAGLVGFLLAFFIVPMTFSVGGEATVAPKEKEYAFCKIGGLIESVQVRQGSFVEKGQVLATLDPRELDYKIKREERQFDLMTKEMALLRSRAVDDPAILAKAKLTELKRESIKAELEFLKWQAEFLTMKAPVAGVVVTKDVETLSGKRMEAGEAFCEIAEPGMLCAEILVPEDRILRIKPGQSAQLYLNNAPRIPYHLTVQEIAPRSEVEPRLGSVFKVTATFVHMPEGTRVGMKGIGTIDTGEVSLWTIVSQRLRARWNGMWLWLG